MTKTTDLDDIRHVMLILQQAMLDPALSGGCPLLGELFGLIAEREEARPLLEATPGWKMPGLLLSAALLYRAATEAGHPLASYLPQGARPLDASFRAAVLRALQEDGPALSALMARHTYQCNPPRRLAVSLVVLAAFMENPAPALLVDLGTASGTGLLLGETRVTSGGGLGPANAALSFPLELRGAPLDLATLPCPKIERAIGIDLDPPDLRAPNCRAWMRACQFPIVAELDFFDHAIDLVLAQQPPIRRGSATDLMPALVQEMPPGQPLIVTDTYMAVFMSEDDRERMRGELDLIAQNRPVIWISNNPLVPPGHAPNCTTAGTPLTPELIERNRRELFGAVCVTTWPEGKRTPRLVALTHPGACWLEWQPGLAALA